MIEAEIRRILKTIAPAINWDAVRVNEDLSSAGLDSLDKVSIIMEIETATGVKIDDARYAEMATISDLMKVTTD